MPLGLQCWVSNFHFDQCLVSGQYSQREQPKADAEKKSSVVQNTTVQLKTYNTFSKIYTEKLQNFITNELPLSMVD